MTKNGDTNGYVQVFKGPDGQPMVVLRAADFTALVNAALAAEKKKGSRDFGKVVARFDFTKDEEFPDAFFKFFASLTKGAQMRSDTVTTYEIIGPLSDEDAYAEAKTALARGEEEVVPGDVAKRLLAGEVPLKVWREYRGLKQRELEDKTGVGQDVISKIENNKRTGDVATLKALADGLGVLVDDLVI